MKLCLRALVFVCAFGMFWLAPSGAQAAHTQENNYTYDFWGNARTSLPAFELVTVLDAGKVENAKLGSLDDVFVGGGRIFLADATESRIHVFDADLRFAASIKLLRDDTGRIIVDPETNKQLMLNQPEGVFYSEAADELYIADTGAERIVVLDGRTYYHKRTIEKPDQMVGATLFKPSKLVVDKDGKISVVVQGSYEGIVELHPDGSFSRYFGLNKPRVNVIDHFWKSMATRRQKEKMKKQFAPSFNNISIDREGFLYATTHDPSAQDMVFRFNAKGENVLRQGGYFPVIGDLVSTTGEFSQFVDIAVSDYGVYALLDRSRGRIFLYNFEGELMNVFNTSGNMKGNVKEPTGIAWFGNNLIVTDRYYGSAYVFQPTEFGHAALEAERHYFYGNWEEAGRHFERAVRLNANYDIAYIGVGRNYLMQGLFEQAMYYLKLGNSRGYYSEAFAEFRNLWIQENFIWLVVPFLILGGALLYSEYRYNKKNG